MGPRADRITRVRNSGIVIVSSTIAIERAEIATNNLDAVSSASVIASSESSTAGWLLPVSAVLPGPQAGKQIPRGTMQRLG